MCERPQKVALPRACDIGMCRASARIMHAYKISIISPYIFELYYERMVLLDVAIIQLVERRFTTKYRCNINSQLPQLHLKYIDCDFGLKKVSTV